MGRFTAKRILITGGTSGIGLATAKRIVEEGGEVAVTGLSQDHLDEAGRALPSGSLVLRNDASDPEAAADLAQKIKSQMDGLDGLFLNAGFGDFAPTGNNDAEFFDAMMTTNVRGPVIQMAALKEQLKEGAAVLMTASVAPYLGMENGAVYGATKASITALSKSWAQDLAPRKIRVNTIAPGPIETRFFDSGNDDEEDPDEDSIAQQVPLGRFGKAEDVAAIACLLLSDEAAYVTGSEYMVDGGMTMR